MRVKIGVFHLVDPHRKKICCRAFQVQLKTMLVVYTLHNDTKRNDC